MNEHIEKLLLEYDKLNEPLKLMSDFVLKFLKTKICAERKMLVAEIEGRIKAKKSLEEKLAIKGHKYKTITDITDLFGARIVTFYSDEVDYIASLIEKEFVIDFKNSIDKRKIYEVDRFGYMSLHYICKIPESLYCDKNHPEINNIPFEIQMRTCLQHTWATIFHDTGYKSDIEVPREYIRRFARLEGLLEIADAEFLSLRNEINEYRTKIRSLVSKGKYSDISFSIDSYSDYIALDPYRSLIKRIASINKCEIEEGSSLRYYKVLVDLGIKKLSEVEDMRINNTEEAYMLSLSELEGTDIDIISSTIAIQNIITIYIIKKGGNREEIKKNLSLLYGTERVTNSFVDKLIEKTNFILKV